ncbi:MAG: delta-60 repeat domain-containing protein [bacterium]|nr:delta-60 repeat domain-containing protein [bacterium]
MKIRGLLFALLAVTLVTSASVVLADATEMWSEQHDGGGNFLDSGTLLSLAPDGNIIVGGESSEVSGGADLYIRKLNKDTGNQIWDFRYDGVDDKDVAISEITWDSVGQLLVAGYIRGCIG